MEIHLPDGNNFIDMLVRADNAYIGDSDAVIPDADETKLNDALAALERGDVEYVVLADGARFLQAAGDARSGYVLEYNDGSDKEQFRATRQNIKGTEIADAFRSYLNRDGRWKTLFTWEKFRL
jgi:hypothetical protein